jgi:hypothetical protein
MQRKVSFALPVVARTRSPRGNQLKTPRLTGGQVLRGRWRHRTPPRRARGKGHRREACAQRVQDGEGEHQPPNRPQPRAARGRRHLRRSPNTGREKADRSHLPPPARPLQSPRRCWPCRLSRRLCSRLCGRAGENRAGRPKTKKCGVRCRATKFLRRGRGLRRDPAASRGCPILAIFYTI